MDQFFISGIQQIGIGIPNVHKAWDWYCKVFDTDIKIFEEAAEAALMTPYTGGEVHARHAILALSIQGGGGFEIWQYTSRTPQPANFDILPGDLGFSAVKIKCFDVKAKHGQLKQMGDVEMSELQTDPNGQTYFWVNDLYNNKFQIVQSSYSFKRTAALTGGVEGVQIGVTNYKKSIQFYSEVLGYDEVVYEKEGAFDDLNFAGDSGDHYKRVLLRHSLKRQGAFSELLGPSEIELIQVTNREPKRIFADRYWGDRGFIHLCFDINGMDALRKRCESLGHPFTIDSSQSFDMGEAAGHFTYIEDPDGALIEFVETHKVPVLKKLGIYLNLKNRKPGKSLPRWMVSSLQMNRRKTK